MPRPKFISRFAQTVKGRRRVLVIASLVLAISGAGAALARLRPGHREQAVLMAAAWSPVSGSAIQHGQPVRPKPLDRPTAVVTFEQGCSNARCHGDINNAAHVHMPVATFQCQTCHAPDAGNHTFPLRAGKTALCTSCHETASHKKFQHQAMTEDGCLACHNPHASNTPNLLTASSLQATCASCHPNAEGSSTHPPYATGRCDVCHDPHGGENKSMLLTGEGQDACMSCHPQAVVKVNKGPHTGSLKPGRATASMATGAELLRQKSCTACHPPHAGSHDGLLMQPTRGLCISCHADIGAISGKSRFTHDAVLKGDQCVTCHDPHGSDHPHSLRDSQPKLCLTCHDKPVKARDGRQVESMAVLATARVVHGAVRDGDCSACHSVHGSENARLLGQLDPSLLADTHAAANYTLCFACHDSALAKPGPATMFRDGDQNLHEMHLRPGGKARGCSSCHSVHASDLPRLIARSVNFEGSGWAMPMGFELTAEGGRCDSSCHEPLSYSRRPGGIRGLKKNEGAP